MSVVEVEQRERILVITLNRPEKRNTFTPEINGLLKDAFEGFRTNDELWVAVLLGRARTSAPGST